MSNYPTEWKDGAFPTATIPPELLKVYEEERAYLAELARADRPPTKTLGSALSPLINVFGCEGGEGGILYERETPEELKIPKLMEQRRVREEEAGFDGQFATVTSHALFKERWDTITHGAFEGFNWENVYACGGSVLGCLLPQNVGFHHSDIDLFLCVETPEEADRALRNIVETITRNTAKITSKPVETFKTKRSISVRTGYRTYQIVTTLYRTLEDVIFAFDIDSCCVGYAGGPDVWITPRARRAIAKRYNLVHLTIPHAHALPGRYERRLFKYARRGFAIAVPGYDRSQIDPNVWLKHTFDASGLEKLLLLDKAVSDHPEMGDPKHFFVTDIDNCIHGGGSWCRVCHKEHSTVEETQSHVQEATINVTTTATANDPIEPSVYIPASTLSAPHQPAQFQPQLPAPTLSANSRLVNGTAPLTWERRHVVFQDLEVDRGKGTAYYTRNLEYVHLGWDDEVYRNEEYAPSSSTTSETERSTKHVLSTVHGYRATVCECGLPAALRTVRKESINKGRQFFGCAQLPPACKHFCWADSRAVPANPSDPAHAIATSSSDQQQLQQQPQPKPERSMSDIRFSAFRGLSLLLSELADGQLVSPIERDALHKIIVAPKTDSSATLAKESLVDAFQRLAVQDDGDDSGDGDNAGSTKLSELAKQWREVLNQTAAPLQ